MKKPIIKKGDKYNYLTAVKFSHRDKKSVQFWIFKCDCGSEKIIRVCGVKNGHIKSCGCLGYRNAFKHGMHGTRIYNIWYAMKRRCLDEEHQQYKNYGGRGIKVCSEWMKFENFYKDMGDRPEGKTLDRINNDGNYCKENCKWSTQKEQMNNVRYNHSITFNGKTQNLSQWAEELNMNCSTIGYRLRKGWSVERALET